jgi:2-polyprenyl-6-methoxyphenol hydroxylase-like FAD-dependent oxidoreductase
MHERLSAAIETDVLIVGAGPVGLFLANECARRGLRWRLVEMRAAQSEHSKALAIFPRTLEIFDMAGVVDPFLEAANRVTSVAVVTHGRTLARMRFEPEESPYPFVAMVPQNVTERLLAAVLRSRGGTIEYETTFVSAVQDGDGVTAMLDRRGERLQICAAFVVGCDGPHSAVRHLLSLPFEGAQYETAYMLADVETNDAPPGDELQLCPSEAGPVAIFPMSATRRRIIASVERPEGDAPSLELVQTVLAERGPRELQARALHWSSYFHTHHRQVARLGIGRIFIAGDAAHIHSPFGGQGMNTGLHDVWNLAWKLDLVVRGHAHRALLETYGAERRPVIKSVIETTDFLAKALGTPSRLAQALRDAVIPMVSRLAPFQHAFVQRLSELGVAYRGSPIVEGAGERWFDDSLRGGSGIRSHFVLVLGRDASTSTVESATALAGALRDVVEIRRGDGDGVTLVRPDGYVAYAARHGDGIAAVQSVLERQLNAPAKAA